MIRGLLAIVSVAAPLFAASATNVYSGQVARFRADREKSLRAEDGWTTVVGLFWLHPGANRAGSAPGSEVLLPASVPGRLGTVTLADGRVEFQPAPGIKIPAQELKEDTTILSSGSVKFFMIRRGQQFGIRVKDSQAPARLQFTHLSWYPVDPSWRIEAKYVAFDKPKSLTFDTVIPGLKENDEAPGYVLFSRGGREYRLEPVVDDGELFFIFRDRTSGKSTYGASRFLYAAMARNGRVILDFNEAINPPCVFTPYATCPLPPPENRLPIEVTAGELMYNNHR